MSSQPQTIEGMTLDEFLARPGLDARPYQEFLDGRIEVKVSPQKKHSAVEGELRDRVNRFARPRKLGLAFVELRCTFAGRSVVPDVVFLLKDHIAIDAGGEYVNETPRPPDIHIEIVSPDESLKMQRAKLAHSTANGCSLGWRIDLERKSIDVFLPGREPERLAPDGALDGARSCPASGCRSRRSLGG